MEVPEEDTGDELLLNVLSDIFYRVEFDNIPSADPNVRVEADGLPNLFDIKKLRLIQWDCDGTHPRLAGTYNVNPDTNSAIVNGFIDGVPNLTQESIAVSECQVFGIAGNSFYSPFRLTDDQFSRVQFINLAEKPGSPFDTVGLSLNDVPVTRLFPPRSATIFGGVEPGTQVSLRDTDADTSVASLPLTIDTGEDYVSISGIGQGGSIEQFTHQVLLDSTACDSSIQVLFFNGLFGGETIDIVLNQSSSVGDNVSPGEYGDSECLSPIFPQSVQIHDAGTGEVLGTVELDLSPYELDESLVITVSPARTGTSSAPRLAQQNITLLIFDSSGERAEAPLVTSVDEQVPPQFPAKFALHKNYPNPFNPSTQIRFAVPEAARIKIVVYNMLGERIRTLVDARKAAGVHSVTWDARDDRGRNVASGVYIYRLEAIAADQQAFVATQKMLLMK